MHFVEQTLSSEKYVFCTVFFMLEILLLKNVFHTFISYKCRNYITAWLGNLLQYFETTGGKFLIGQHAILYHQVQHKTEATRAAFSHLPVFICLHQIHYDAGHKATIFFKFSALL